MTEDLPDSPESDLPGGEDPPRPPEKMGTAFYAALALIGLLVLMILFLNYPATKAEAGSALAENNWTLQSITGPAGIPVPAQNGTVTAAFDRQGGIIGSTGCNRYSARYNTTEYRITITAISSTKISCPGTGIMEQESAFLNGLAGASYFRISESSLKFYDAAGKTILVLVPA